MFGLPDHIVELLRDYFSNKEEILQVRIYGSRALGKEKKGSDIDFAVWTTSDRDLSGHLKLELEELPTPYLFDVVDYTTIQHEGLKAHIDRASKVFFKR